jgi:hypothetical protein
MAPLGGRRFRVVPIAIAGLVCLGAAAWLLLHSPAVRRPAQAWAQARLSEMLGRAVSAERLQVSLVHGALELEDVQVRGGPADPPLLAAPRVRIHWSWVRLVLGNLRPTAITLVRPVFSLPPAPGAALNGLVPGLGPGPSAARGAPGERLEILDGTVRQPGLGIDGLSGTVRWEDGATAAVALRAQVVYATLAGARREAHRVALSGSLAAGTLTLASAEATVGEVAVTLAGRLLDLDTPLFDLQVTVTAPLGAGTGALLAASGRVTGRWPALAFAGEGRWAAGSVPGQTHSVGLDAAWREHRLEFETTGRTGGVWARAVWEPAGGQYEVRLGFQKADLGQFADWPVVARLLHLPLPPVHGRLSGECAFRGSGGALASLQGQGNIRVDDLVLTGGFSATRLEARGAASAAGITLDLFRIEIPGGAVQGHGLAWRQGEMDLAIQADFPDLAPFSRSVGLPALSGAAALRGRAFGPWQAPRLQGRLAWTDPGLAFGTVDAIEGEVEAGGRTLSLARLLVRRGQTSAVLTGSLTAAGTRPLAGLERQDVSVHLQVQIGAGRFTDLRQFLPAGLDLRGAFRAEGRIDGTAASPVAELALVLAHPEVWGAAWESGEARLRWRPAGIEIPAFHLRRGREQLSGELRAGADGRLAGRLDGVDLDLSRLDLTAGTGVTGRVAAQLTLQGTAEDTRAEGRASTDALALADVPLGPVAATVLLSRAGTDLSLRLQRDAIRAHLVIGPAGSRNPRLELTLQDADLDPMLQAARFEIPRAWRPRASGRVQVRGLSDEFATTSGEAALTALRLEQGGRTWSNLGPADLSWRDGTVTLRQVRVRAGGDQELTLQGTVGENGRADLDVSGRLPISALGGELPGVQPLAGTLRGTVHVSGPLSAPALRGRLDVLEGRFRVGQSPAPLENLQAQVELQPGRMVVTDARGQWAGGAVRGSGEVLQSGGRSTIRASVQAENSRLEQVLPGPAGRQTTGAFSFNGTFSSRGRGEQEFWENLAGELQVSAREGRLGRQSFMVKVLSLSNLRQLFTTQDLDWSAQGIPFRRLTGSFSIERGMGRTEDCLLEARPFNASAVGRVDLAEQTVDLEVAIKPFQTLDLLSQVPLVGWLLTGKERSLIAAFYRVSGPIADPTVRPLPLKDISRNVFGVFGRLLHLPAALEGGALEHPPVAPETTLPRR